MITLGAAPRYNAMSGLSCVIMCSAIDCPFNILARFVKYFNALMNTIQERSHRCTPMQTLVHSV